MELLHAPAIACSRSVCAQRSAQLRPSVRHFGKHGFERSSNPRTTVASSQGDGAESLYPYQSLVCLPRAYETVVRTSASRHVRSLAVAGAGAEPTADAQAGT